VKDASQITACLVDHGVFFGLAQQLSRTYKRVLYHNSGWERGSSSTRDGTVGDGFDEVELCMDIWKMKDDIDLFIFPDVEHSGLQLELESQGKLVWGSRDGDSIELLRKKFLDVIESVGLEVPKYEIVKGLSNLRTVLKNTEDKYIKISRWRADMETWHHINYELSRGELDKLAMKWGPLQDEIQFLVFDPIETDLEVGYDGYNIDGWFPNTAVHGIEKKSKGYIGAIQDYDDLPEQVREVNEKMSPVLKKFRYRNFLSTEIRIQPDSFKFIDPTQRAGNPSGDAQFLLYKKNLPEIILAGAAGEVVEPEVDKKFCAQVMITHEDPVDQWREIQVPDEVSEYVRLFSPVKVGDVIGISPSSNTGTTIGSVLGEGDTIEEAIEHVKSNAEKLKHNHIDINTDCLMDVLKDIQSARDQGVEMTSEEIPEPATVIEE
jgi:hypothetical protein